MIWVYAGTFLVRGGFVDFDVFFLISGIALPALLDSFYSFEVFHRRFCAEQAG